jgi:hypothetical protein
MNISAKDFKLDFRISTHISGVPKSSFHFGDNLSRLCFTACLWSWSIPNGNQDLVLRRLVRIRIGQEHSLTRASDLGFTIPSGGWT